MVQKIISTAEIKEEELIEEGIDFIVSTAKLNLTFPNVYVNSILTETDKKMINAMIKISTRRKEKSHKDCKTSQKDWKRRHRVYDTSWRRDLTGIR